MGVSSEIFFQKSFLHFYATFFSIFNGFLYDPFKTRNPNLSGNNSNCHYLRRLKIAVEPHSSSIGTSPPLFSQHWKICFSKFFYVVEQKKSFPPYGDYYWKLDLLRYNRQSKDTESKTSMPQWAKKLGGKYFDILFFAPQTTSRLLGLKKKISKTLILAFADNSTLSCPKFQFFFPLFSSLCHVGYNRLDWAEGDKK